MGTKLKIALVSFASVALGALGGDILITEPIDVSKEALLERIPSKVVDWEKPTTDAQWAEDVRLESFDIKSDGVLNTMIGMHQSKLDRKQKELSDARECPECLYFEIQRRFRDSGEKDWEKMAEDEYNQTLSNLVADIEKLDQSVIRMKKELELRQKGFVIVADKDVELKLGGKVPPERIRYIND